QLQLLRRQLKLAILRSTHYRPGASPAAVLASRSLLAPFYGIYIAVFNGEPIRCYAPANRPWSRCHSARRSWHRRSMVPLPRSVFSTFLASRIVLFAVALFAVSHLPINVAEARGFHLAPQPHSYLEAWARYDACWYVTIAEAGYRGSIDS